MLVAALLLAFFVCLTCFFAVVLVAVLPVVFAGVEAVFCAASDNPAVARVRERPSTADAIFFILGFLFSFEACRPACLCIV